MSQQIIKDALSTASHHDILDNGGMTSSPALHGSEDYLAAMTKAFGRCPDLSGLRLTTVQVQDGVAAVRFEGPVADFRGPYGVRVRLPRDEGDPLWEEHARRDTLEAWAQQAVVVHALEAYEQSLSRERGYTPDGTWWLEDQTDR